MRAIPTLSDLMQIIGVGFGLTGLSHAIGNPLAAWFASVSPGLERYSLTSSFFWIVELATTFGLPTSFARAKALEGAGAPKGGQADLDPRRAAACRGEAAAGAVFYLAEAATRTSVTRRRRRSWPRPSTRLAVLGYPAGTHGGWLRGQVMRLATGCRSSNRSLDAGGPTLTISTVRGYAEKFRAPNRCWSVHDSFLLDP